MVELWRPVLGYEGKYEVSNIGRVKSLYRVIIDSLGRRHITKEKIKKPTLKKGYHLMILSKNDKSKTHMVHQLVASAFLTNENNYVEVNHKNCIKIDNRVENLEWCSRLENVRHSIKNKRNVYRIGVENKSSKLSNQQASEIFYSSLKCVQLEKFYPVKKSLISKIRCGKSNYNTYPVKH